MASQVGKGGGAVPARIPGTAEGAFAVRRCGLVGCLCTSLIGVLGMFFGFFCGES